MDRWKSRGGKSQRREEKKREDQRRERARRKKIQAREKVGARKGRKVAKHCVSPMICGSGGSKSRIAKAAGAEPCGHMTNEKLHVVVARSTFPSQNVQNTPCSDHFWKLRCRKSARCCGVRHISKSKCTKHAMFGPLLEVEMSKKCKPLASRCDAKHISKSKCANHTRFGALLEVAMSKKCMQLWCEAHFQVKMCKAHHARTTFGSWDVEKVQAVVMRSTFWSQNVQSTPGPDHFWKLRCRKSACSCGAKHISKSKCAKHTMLGPKLRCRKSARRCGAKHTSKSKCVKTH